MSNEAETIAGLAVKAAGAHTIKAGDGREFLLVPTGFTEKEISDPHGLKLTTPRYIHQGVTVQALDSLVEYVNSFKTPNTMLFADIMANSITALIDYHSKDQKAQNVAHRVTMALPFSEEWKLWTSIDGKMVGQLEFARFLEENHPDIAQPNAAELIEMARDLHAARNIKFSKVVRTDSDNENFTAEDATTLGSRSTGNSVELPRQFTVRIPVYFGEEAIDISAFLRWKVGDEGMTLGIKLWRPEHVRQAMFKQIVVGAAEHTNVTAVFGKVG
jgi:uncharacterized protein YfdQ (DUF2303 family)